MKRLPSSLYLATYVSTGIVLALILVNALVAQTIALGEPTPDHRHDVNSVGDEEDNDLSDGMCMTSMGECTLRAAIQQANATENLSTGGDIVFGVPDEIHFVIAGPGVHTILPLSSLPDITDAVLIDGYTHGGASANTMADGSDAVLFIELDGSLAGAFTHGLTLKSSGSTIRGLVINRFGLANILLDGANENHIEGNFIGTDATGTSPRPNGADGIALFDSASNIIGGATPDKRNVISGNAWSGVAILNGPSQGNIVEGNYIGTDPSGLNDVGNEQDGVLISALVGVSTYASMNRIGGVEPGQGNLISGNGWSGVEIVRGTQNEILGNLIGTTADGTTRLKNNSDGVLLFEASNNLVGGQFASDGSGEIEFFKRNVISGNGFCGVDIFVRNQPADGNLVVGNLIGTDISGLEPLPNNACGVFLGSAVGATASVTNNIIGGTDGTSASRNIISGNGGSGVLLVGSMVTTNEIVGNFIGLNLTGTAKLGNTLDGVRFTTFSGQTTGPFVNFIGDAPNGGNVISGNGRDGVAIAFGSGANFVVNNIIGLDASGTGTDPDGIPMSGDELGNTRHGVAIFDSSDNFVGLSSDEPNIISGNLGSGVFIGVGPVGGVTIGNGIYGNYIGVDITGAGNGTLGNLGDGVLIDGTPNNIIGGVEVADANVISRNGRDGVHITGANATGNKLFRNLIGVESDASTDSGNRRHGVFIGDGASNNTIGDVTNEKGNVIAFSALSGVAVESGTGNAIRGNAIFDNGGLGVDLGGDGLTENDSGDGDPGPNNLQNFPIILVKFEDGNTVVDLQLNMAGSTTFHFDVYANETGDGISAGQGRTYLTTETATTPSSGMRFVENILIRGERSNITVTATDEDGNTSEFGREPLVHSVEFTQAIQILQPTNLFLLWLETHDGEPPVPMIAGKEGVMRIYLRNVEADTEVFFLVEGEGFKRTTDSVISKPVCTPDSRRRTASGPCKSVDFYFTPPQGEWDVTLTLKNATPGPAIGTVFERHRFRQVTRTAKTLVIKAAKVCHDINDKTGEWICGDHKVLKNLPGFLQSIAPTHDVRVDPSWAVIRHRLTLEDVTGEGELLQKIVDEQGDLYERDLWRATVLTDLAIYYTLSEFLPRLNPFDSEERYIMGVMKPNDGVAFGRAHDHARAAFMQERTIELFGDLEVDTTKLTLAHETAHMMGREHTNKGNRETTWPGCRALAFSTRTDWPFCDNKIRSTDAPCQQTPCQGCRTGVLEYPFDVRLGHPLDARNIFDLMSYCNPQWIAPINYLAMANNVLAPKTSSATEQTAGTPEPVAGTFWLVAGEVEDGNATIRPLFQLDTIGLDAPREGSHRIEIRDASEGVLFTRFFNPRRTIVEVEDPDVTVPRSFAELIPKDSEALSIVVFDDLDVELGRITLGGVAPTVTVEYSPGVDPQSGQQSIEWTIVDPDSAEHTVWVHYSNDNGLTWHYVGIVGSSTQVTLNFDNLPGADGSCIFRVLASDGMNTGFGDSDPFSVAKKLPQVEILFPQDGTVFRRGELVWLQSSASDGDDGTLDDTAVVWTSSIAGDLGEGEDLPLGSLGVGIHTITVTGTDSDGNIAQDSIDIEVEDSLLVEVVPVIHVPADQPTIQAGIDAAFPGGEVLVAPGTYDEIIDFHGKAITLRSSGGADVTIIDATLVVDPGDGKPVVRCDSGEGPTTVLDGFTITGGTGDTGMSGAEFPRGGGMFNNGSSPTVTNCTFSGNAVNFSGGGMSNIVSSPAVTNCTFDGNSAQSGGGMSNFSNSDPIVVNCKFSGNTAERFGGGIFNNSSSPTVTNCRFNGNAADFGGGMYSFSGSPTVTNCMFSGNEALSDGGGMMNRLCSPTATGCTFGGNTALSDGGGMMNLDSSDPAVTNCIFWMNSDLGGTDESGQIHNDDTLGPNSPTVNFSDIQGGWTGLGGVGNINVDPQFMDANGPDNILGTEDDDLRLLASSPCIDSGDPAFVAGIDETDLDGHVRVLCDRVEMGAYEFAGDFACDQTIDLDDFANWDACMTGPGGGPYAPGCATFDCDADMDIDMKDFAEFENVFTP